MRKRRIIDAQIVNKAAALGFAFLGAAKTRPELKPACAPGGTGQHGHGRGAGKLAVHIEGRARLLRHNRNEMECFITTFDVRCDQLFRGALVRANPYDERTRALPAANDDIFLTGDISHVQRQAIGLRTERHDCRNGKLRSRPRELAFVRIRREPGRVDGVRPADRTRRICFGSLVSERDGRRTLVRRGEAIRRWLGFEVPPDRRHEAGDIHIRRPNRKCGN